MLTFNTWVGDYRRGFASRDHERLRWIEASIRREDPDVIALQEVLEADLERWYESTFAEYEWRALHQPSNPAGRFVWLLCTLAPALAVACALALLGAVGRAAAAAWGLGVWLLLERTFTSPGYPSWAPYLLLHSFPVYGSRSYFTSTTASLAIGVRRSFASVEGIQTGFFREQGKWVNETVGGVERELRLFNPDRWLNLLRRRGVLGLTLRPHSLPGFGLRLVNVHLNIVRPPAPYILADAFSDGALGAGREQSGGAAQPGPAAGG